MEYIWCIYHKQHPCEIVWYSVGCIVDGGGGYKQRLDWVQSLLSGRRLQHKDQHSHIKAQLLIHKSPMSFCPSSDYTTYSITTHPSNCKQLQVTNQCALLIRGFHKLLKRADIKCFPLLGRFNWNA